MNTTMSDSGRELKSLYEKYAPMVHARCKSILKSNDEAWDATQDIFMKLLSALPNINKKESIFSWLISTTTHHCISQLRKKKGISFDEDLHNISERASPQERRMIFDEIFKHFFFPWDKTVREVVIYTYFDGYKQDEVAELTGMGESTVRRHLTRFKRKAAESGLKLEDLLYE